MIPDDPGIHSDAVDIERQRSDESACCDGDAVEDWQTCRTAATR